MAPKAKLLRCHHRHALRRWGVAPRSGVNQRSRRSWNTVCSNTTSRLFQRQRSKPLWQRIHPPFAAARVSRNVAVSVATLFAGIKYGTLCDFQGLAVQNHVPNFTWLSVIQVCRIMDCLLTLALCNFKLQVSVNLFEVSAVCVCVWNTTYFPRSLNSVNPKKELEKGGNWKHAEKERNQVH